jgi:pantetheine-phosphate adenylyltransferase
MKKTALFPGSFDPFTKGHEDIVLRSLNLFDEIVIGIGHNSQKVRYIDIKIMKGLIEKTFAAHPQVKVELYEGLTAKFAQKINAKFLIRGLRNTTDFEYENTIAQANVHVWNEIETVFLITSPHLAYISSSVVRDIHKGGGDVSSFLPYQI